MFGTAAKNDSTYLYRSGIKAENCYAAKVKGENICSAFFQQNHAAQYIANCMYSDIDTTLSDATKGTVDEVTERYSELSAFCADNYKASINGGYPVLAWQNTWNDKIWDGTAIDTEWDGNGTAESPYKITSAAELAGLASKTFHAISTSTDVPVAQANGSNMYNAYTDVYFKLMCDIDLDNKEWTPIGRIGMRFNGSFDGNGHVVRNLSVSDAYLAKGFFRCNRY